MKSEPSQNFELNSKSGMNRLRKNKATEIAILGGIGIAALTGCAPQSEAVAPQPPTSTSIEEDVTPAITYEAELAATLAERPAVGSAEYEALVASYTIKASEHSTPEDIALAFGDTLVQDWFTAGFDEIPKDYYEQSQVVYTSIGDLAEMLEPGYWNEVFSEALFGTDIANLTAEQLKVYEAIVGDQNMFIKQRILTNEQDNPTDLIATNETVSFDYTTGVAADGDLLNGDYEFDFWPNKDNSLTNANDNDAESKPRHNTIGFTLRLDAASGNWYYVGSQR